MKVIVDTNPFEIEEPCENLKAAIVQVERYLVGKHRVIVKISLDGRELNPEDENSLSTYGSDRIEILEFHSERPADLVSQGIKDGVEEIFPELFNLLEKLTNSLRKQKINEASVEIQNLTEFLTWVVTMTNNLYRTHPHFMEGVEGIKVKKKFKELEGQIQDLCNFQEDEDWVGLADILEYELKENLEFINKIFITLSKVGEKMDD